MAIKLNKPIGEAKKRRKVSKKRKRSWRKHVDTKDVDKFLENQRLEERLGAPFAIRPDTELFTVDSTPSVQPSEHATKAAYREALRNAEPKCYASLKPHTAVPDPLIKRNRVKTPDERKNPITRRIEEERKSKGELKLKEKVATINRNLAEVKRLNRPKRGDYNLDIWKEGPSILPAEIDTQWIKLDTMRHTLATKGIKQKVPKSLFKKPSAIPAVDIPHPGISYNPSYKDHQALLRGIADEELKFIKEEAHLNRVTTRMFKKVSAVEKDQNWLTECSEGLPLYPSKPNAESENNDSDNEVKSINPPVKNAKKTLVKRRKQREQRKLALELKHKKVEKKKIGDIYKLKFLAKNIANKEQKVEVLREKRKKVQAIKAMEPKVLSRTKYEAPAVDFKMSDELTGNLRSAEPAGNMLRDRYKSLQQRSIVAPTKLVLYVFFNFNFQFFTYKNFIINYNYFVFFFTSRKHLKPKVKKYIKPDHKIVLPGKSKSK